MTRARLTSHILCIAEIRASVKRAARRLRSSPPSMIYGLLVRK
jgi:hypothetical protein